MRLYELLAGALPAPATSGPVNGIAPSVTGSPVVGDVLSSNAGSWEGKPTPSEAGQWQVSADGSTGWTDLGPAGVDRSTGTYTIQAGDDSKYVSILITSTNVAGTATARSNVVGPVTTPLSPPSPISPPVITTP